MVEALIALLIVVLIAAVIGAVIVYAIGLMPIDARLKQIAIVIVWLIVALIILMRALPMLGNI